MLWLTGNTEKRDLETGSRVIQDELPLPIAPLIVSFMWTLSRKNEEGNGMGVSLGG